MESSVSETSVATPSLLDSTTVSSISTSDSYAFGMYAARMNLKPGAEMKAIAMTNEVHINDGISAIVENPAEENGEIDVPTTAEFSKEEMKHTDFTVPAEVAQEPKQRAPMKRKSMNLFRRNAPEPLQSPNDTNHQLNSKLSMGSIRRSVVGLARPKSAIFPSSGGRTFDASHLPPSPGIPVSFADRQDSSLGPNGFQRGGSVTRRAPLAPTMHSRGSILIEASGIEDEESRRMTELAFCG